MDYILRRVYSGLWHVAILIFHLIALFKPKFASWLKGREASKIILRNYQADKEKYTVWLHSSSLGEYEQGKPILQELRKNYPHINIVVTFFSASGYDIIIKDKLPDVVLYLPFDTISSSHDFLDKIRPDLAIFVKYDVWPNVVLEAKKRRVKLLLIAALIKEKSFYLKDSSMFFKQAYLAFDKIYVQNQQSIKLLQTHGFKSLSIAGDPRVDRVMGIAKQEFSNEKLEQWIGGKRVFTFGSNHSGEDDELTRNIILKINEEFPGEFKFLIFPHHIHAKRVEELREVLDMPCAIYTEEGKNISKQIMIVNTIGMLSLSYRYAEMVYIGGGFDGAVHNLLEPAAYYVPLFSGPGMGNFLESVLFRESGIMHVFTAVGEADLFSFKEYLGKRSQIEDQIKLFFSEASGGTKIISRDIYEYLNPQ